MKRNHNVFWGLILVLIGLFLAFDRWLGISLWRLAGPSFIILLGMWLVLQGMGSRSVGAAGRGRSSSREVWLHRAASIGTNACSLSPTSQMVMERPGVCVRREANRHRLDRR